MDERSQILKSKFCGPVQEVILPDFPDDDNTVTTTVTKSRRVSFGTNFIKEFIVGSAVSAQCVSEYEQAFSSSDSSIANSSHSAIGSGIFNQNTFVLEDDHKEQQSINPDFDESQVKRPKISSTICFSADSPTTDMEFTEGCISLAKSIIVKKNKELTVFIQAKPKESKDETKTVKEDDTKYFEGSQFDMSITKCFKSKENRKEEKKFESEKTKIFNKYDNEMSITRCDQVLKMRQSKVPNDDEESEASWVEDDCKENQIPLDLIMHHLDKDNSDLENLFFNPEKPLSEVLNANPFDNSNESEKLNMNESMDITSEFQPKFFESHQLPSSDSNMNEDEDKLLKLSKTDAYKYDSHEQEVKITQNDIGISKKLEIEKVEQTFEKPYHTEISQKKVNLKESEEKEKEELELPLEKKDMEQSQKINQECQIEVIQQELTENLQNKNGKGEKAQETLQKIPNKIMEEQDLGQCRGEEIETAQNQCKKKVEEVEKEQEQEIEKIVYIHSIKMREEGVENTQELVSCITDVTKEKEQNKQEMVAEFSEQNLQVIENTKKMTQVYQVDIAQEPQFKKTQDQEREMIQGQDPQIEEVIVENSLTEVLKKQEVYKTQGCQNEMIPERLTEVTQELPIEIENEIKGDNVETDKKSEIIDVEIKATAIDMESMKEIEAQKIRQYEMIEDKSLEIAKEQGVENIKEQNFVAVEEKGLENMKEIDVEMMEVKNLEIAKEQEIENIKKKNFEVVKEKNMENMKEIEVEMMEVKNLEIAKEQEIENVKEKNFEVVKEKNMENMKEIEVEMMEVVNLEIPKEQEIENIKEKNFKVVKEKNMKNMTEIEVEMMEDKSLRITKEQEVKDIEEQNFEVVEEKNQRVLEEDFIGTNCLAIEKVQSLEIKTKDIEMMEQSQGLGKELDSSVLQANMEVEMSSLHDGLGQEMSLSESSVSKTNLVPIETPMEGITAMEQKGELTNTDTSSDETMAENGAKDNQFTRNPSLVDTKVIENLNDQSREPGCMWTLKDVLYPLGQQAPGLLSFNITLLESWTTVTFTLKGSNDDSLNACSIVSASDINLSMDNLLKPPEYKLVVDFGFKKLKKNFEEERKSVKTIRHLPYFLDQMNLFVFKINTCLRQVYSIMTLYPGSKLKGSSLSFRLFSFPLFFSSTISIDLTDFCRFSKSSLSFSIDFGSLDKNRVSDIFQECLKCENGLVEFVVRSTRYLIDLERKTGYVSKREHIGLLPVD